MSFFKKHEAWLIFFASLTLFLYGFFSRELIGKEIYFALLTKQMHLAGGPQEFLTLHNISQAHYWFGLSFLSYLFSLSQDHLTTLTAILPSALAASVSLVFIYQIAAPVSREWARIAVLLTLFTYQFFDGARSMSTETLIMLCSSWALYLCLNNKKLIYLFLPLISAFFIQGIFGFISPMLITIACYSAKQQWDILKKYIAYTTILLLILTLALLLIAATQFGFYFAYQLLGSQLLGQQYNSTLLHYCFTLFSQYSITGPLALISIFLSIKKITGKTQDSSLLLSLLFNILLIFIVLGLIAKQKADALLAITPGLALISSHLWLQAKTNAAARFTITSVHLACLALPFIAILLTTAALVSMHLKELPINIHYYFSAFCCLSLLALISSFILYKDPIHYSLNHSKRIIMIGLASFVVAMIFVVKPIEVSLNNSKPFTMEVLSNLSDYQSISFLQLDLMKEPSRFMANLPGNKPITFYFINQIDWNNSNNTLYITRTEIFDAFPDEIKQQLAIIESGQLGYQPMVGFIIRQHHPN